MSSDLLDRSLWTAQNLCLGDLSTSPHEPVHDYCLGDSSENMIYVCLGPHVRMPRYMRIVFRSLLSVDRGGLSRDNTGVTSITRRLVAPPTGAYETPVCLEVGLTYDLTAILVTPPPISTMVISSSPSQTGLPIRGHKAGGTFSVLGSENMFWQRLVVDRGLKARVFKASSWGVNQLPVAATRSDCFVLLLCSQHRSQPCLPPVPRGCDSLRHTRQLPITPC